MIIISFHAHSPPTNLHERVSCASELIAEANHEKDPGVHGAREQTADGLRP